MSMRKLSNDELNRPDVSTFKQQDKMPVYVVLDNVRSLNNVGSVFRTCDAFAIKELILCGITAIPPNKEIHKTALGAEDTVVWKYFENTRDAIHYLKEMQVSIYSIEQAEQSIPLNNLNLSEQPIAVVFGNEVDGVEQSVIDVSDGVIEIPQWGTKHSLNISVSAGIVLWELVRGVSL
jgi:23S rRNA (guanosine2251-2'-O)-methyltransferase